ncbi:hypothetical protein RMATCC62417_10195 [Rhizopus microsporus]|nr:hypothetical protein RMATCC62417_10195 [Rhizopus microsporus]
MKFTFLFEDGNGSMYDENGEEAMNIAIGEHEEMEVEKIISFDTHQAKHAVVDQVVPDAVDDQSAKEAPSKIRHLLSSSSVVFSKVNRFRMH